MSIRIPRTIAIGAATLLAAGSITMAGTAAHAAETVPTVGTLTLNPATGTDEELISLVSSAACPGGTNLQGLVFGAGFPVDGFGVTANQAQSNFPVDGQGHLTVPLSDTMRGFAQKNGFSTLAGKYEFRLRCRAKLGTTYFGDFVGAINFNTPTSYTTVDTTPVATATSTALTVTPNGSATVGGDVKLSAAVTPAADGTVQFLDGSTPLGAPVAVTAGAAELTVNTLTLGAHNLSAVFTSTSTAFLGSTSSTVSYTISPKGAAATTTALAITPAGSAAKNTPVALSATVTPAGTPGAVEFRDGGTLLGTQSANAGTAGLTVANLAEGDHLLTATFVPAVPADFAASTSPVVPFTVTPPVVVPNPGDPLPPSPVFETITTTVAPGALVISVAGTNVTLPPLTLNGDSTLYSTTGAIQTVTVTDTRAGAPGWSVSGRVDQFASGANQINAQNLGWAPNLVSKGDGLKINLGGQIAPANAVAAADAGVFGLKSSRTLATATGLGTAKLGADLTLLAPTSTLAGTYQGLLTLTAI